MYHSPTSSLPSMLFTVHARTQHSHHYSPVNLWVKQIMFGGCSKKVGTIHTRQIIKYIYLFQGSGSTNNCLHTS